ncbi:MAG: nucleotidyltransferase family protein [Pseudomonadales bacterium]|nr:nucleotidyltransferase family protein [Pseudomonadales bacterium]
MSYEAQIKQWILDDPERLYALETAAKLDLNDWCLAAGFVRNMVWDRLHGSEYHTPLNDIDLIYFDPNNCDEDCDRSFERKLKADYEQPWSVKNQARMHIRNSDSPYSSTSNAMSYWVEIETAVGVYLSSDQRLEIIAPFGCESLFKYTITINNKRRKPEDFSHRSTDKGWLKTWPLLSVDWRF